MLKCSWMSDKVSSNTCNFLCHLSVAGVSGFYISKQPMKPLNLAVANAATCFKLISALFFSFYFSELCWGKAMVAYTMPQQRKKERSVRLRGERDKIKFIYFRFERWQVVGLRKARRMQHIP